MHLTKCGATRATIDALIAGTLTTEQSGPARAHIATCPRCTHAFAVRSAVRDALSDRSADVEVPSGFRQALIERLASPSLEPNRTLLPETLPSSLSLGDRLAEWWDGARQSMVARPVATLAVSVVAVVLALLAAQVVGTRHDPSGVAPSSPEVAETVQPPSVPTLPPAIATHTSGVEQPAAPFPAPTSDAEPVATLASLTLAAVSPDARSVITSDGVDVVAAFDGATIDPHRARVTMRVDDVDVSADARVTPEFVVYTPGARLSAGTHTVHIDVADASGARRTVSWEFYVVES